MEEVDVLGEDDKELVVMSVMMDFLRFKVVTPDMMVAMIMHSLAVTN